MNLKDRIIALKFSENYKKEYEHYNKYLLTTGKNDCFLPDSITPIIRLSSAGQELCRKYQIPFPVNPDFIKSDGTMIVFPGPQEVPIEDAIRIPAILPLPLKISKGGKHIFGLKDGKYLNAQIDMSQRQDVITREMEKLHRFYNPQARRGSDIYWTDEWPYYRIEGKKKRDRSSDIEYRDKTLTHWQVYEARQIKGILQITQELLDTQKTTADPEVRAYYDRILKAYNKARRQLREFESSL